ncbi:(Fe-S)-binding protein [Acetobacter pasteurianus]|uniref:aromatic ring-hydroxylating oxygenase subunit alpha n=1 Tax=Acetobacter pasteurianus TaxID=438 RepID=UPI0022C77A1E|nr:aromatic ring-hydroxylating dioxygenase subunit alpha [Acetobacter pasteurianus]GLH30373.1 (Fe-S)-binding protein [Acetobacter pasteurianus]
MNNITKNMIKPLERCWYPVAWTKDLKNKPIGSTILGHDLVVFRDSNGTPHALQDRCPHKNVKLSLGVCNDEGIECPYHGWVFNGQGECIHIPSNIIKQKIGNKLVPTYLCKERQGTVWVCLSDIPYCDDPPAWHFPNNPGFRTIIDMDCNYIRLMENLVDNPHAGFIHGGLLRGRPTTDVVSHISESNSGVLAVTVGEKAKNSLIYRLLGKEDKEIDHTEEFIYPNIIRTVFSHPGSTHASSQFHCVPVSHNKVRVFYRVSLKFPLSSVVIPFFKRMVDKVLVQDKIMLEQEETQSQKYARDKTKACSADVAAAWVARAARAFEQYGPPDKASYKTTDTCYRL